MVGKDDLGDRMKEYEQHETGRKFLSMLPIYARIDGRGFSKFTRGMVRPFDPAMSAAMIETTRYLVQHTGALIGFTQSDEISLAWKAPDHRAAIFFNGKIAKMTSVLAGMATAAFSRTIRGWEPYENRYPAFDARVLQMPLDYEVANMFLWRTLDAERNAISMAAQARFSHKELQGKSQIAMAAMLKDAGVDFAAYPVSFRQGTWIRRVTREMPIFSGDRVSRSFYESIEMPSFRRVANRTEVIFLNHLPEEHPVVGFIA
jgi:tRNA(His) guanylyltransferase